MVSSQILARRAWRRFRN